MNVIKNVNIAVNTGGFWRNPFYFSIKFGLDFSSEIPPFNLQDSLDLFCKDGG